MFSEDPQLERDLLALARPLGATVLVARTEEEWAVEPDCAASAATPPDATDQLNHATASQMSAECP